MSDRRRDAARTARIFEQVMSDHMESIVRQEVVKQLDADWHAAIQQAVRSEVRLMESGWSTWTIGRLSLRVKFRRGPRA